MRRVSFAVVAISFIALIGLPASAATSISIVDFRFATPLRTVSQGGTVTWHNASTGGFQHTATQNRPLGLWNTGILNPGQTSSIVRLLAAGSYPYHCNVHPSMHGIVQVPILVSPRHGMRMTNFTIRLASATRSGFTFDVQRKIGSGAWKTWKTAVRSRIVTFRHGPGTYRFRSRLHKLANGATSGWSPPARITIG